MKSTAAARRNLGKKKVQGKELESQSKSLIDVRQAVKAAAEYFAALYSDKKYSDLLVEEVELSETKKRWLITLSYASEPPSEPTLGQLLAGKERPRTYKIFEIEAATGKVNAMRMRSV
jgi:hypothetical protein